MKTNRTLMIAVFTAVLSLAAWLSATEVNGGDYVHGELIVKLEPGMINLLGFDETPIEHVSVLTPQFSAALQQYEVRSVKHVFKGIFARPPFSFTTKIYLTTHKTYL